VSELVCGKNPNAHLTHWMDKGRDGVPLKREYFEGGEYLEGGEWVR
jgi:hypothetical protein